MRRQLQRIEFIKAPQTTECIRSLGSTYKRYEGKDEEMDVDVIARNLVFVLKDLAAVLIYFRQIIAIKIYVLEKLFFLSNDSQLWSLYHQYQHCLETCLKTKSPGAITD